MADVQQNRLEMHTTEGTIRIRLLPDAAPETVKHILQLVGGGLYNGACFYRSDFVIQCGLHGSSKSNPFPDLQVNETKLHNFVTNGRGTCAVAHWDVPDCGNSEFFINLGSNKHLDAAYGGYCIFAKVEEDDAESFLVIDKIAETIAKVPGTTIPIISVESN